MRLINLLLLTDLHFCGNQTRKLYWYGHLKRPVPKRTVSSLKVWALQDRKWNRKSGLQVRLAWILIPRS